MQTTPVSRRYDFVPDEAPGILVKYLYSPEQQAMPMTRDGDGEEGIDAYVTVKEVLVDGCDILPWLELHGFERDRLEEGILRNHRE